MYSLKVKDENRDNPEVAQKSKVTDAKTDSVYVEIKGKLADLKHYLNEANFEKLTTCLHSYFTQGRFNLPQEPITFIKKPSQKLVGCILKKVYMAQKPDMQLIKAKDYLQFAKDHISIFKATGFDPDDIKGSLLYKYFTASQ